MDQVGAGHNIRYRQILRIGLKCPGARYIRHGSIRNQAPLAHEIGRVLLFQEFLIVLSRLVIGSYFQNGIQFLLSLLVGTHFIKHLGIVDHLCDLGFGFFHLIADLAHFFTGNTILHQGFLLQGGLTGTLSLETGGIHAQSVVQFLNGQLIVSALDRLFRLIDTHFRDAFRDPAVFVGRAGLAYLTQRLVGVAIEARGFSPIACGAGFISLVQICFYLYNSFLASDSFFFSDLCGSFYDRCVLSLDGDFRPESHQQGSTKEEACFSQHVFSVLVNFHTTSFTVQHYISKSFSASLPGSIIQHLQP